MLSSWLLNEGSKMFGKKWRIAIIHGLADGPLRFSELLKKLGGGCSVKVLSECLDKMEEDKLIIRKQYPSIPVKVTYELNPSLTGVHDIMDKYHKVLYSHFSKYATELNVPAEIKHLLDNEINSPSSN